MQISQNAFESAPDAFLVVDRAGRPELTERLLAFSREQVFRVEVLDLNRIVGEVGSLLRPLLGEDILFAHEPSPRPALVRADAGQLEQLLVNLALNARDAMPSGGRLTVQTAHIELGAASAPEDTDLKPGGYVRLTVRDTGYGMSEATKARVFEPFATTKNVGEGSGLGLATVYGIVRQSDGQITVESELGRGTTFHIDIPQAAEPPAAVRPAEVPCDRETILLVEDEGRVRKLLVQILRSFGYQVLEAPNGVDARRVSDQHAGPIHLLVTDVVMPELSGGELVKEIRTRRPETKFLFVSGYNEDVVVRHAVRHDEGAFLQKPFSAAVLAAKVRELLNANPPR